jgi:catechol 2,3-dioxygenase-like lactoylglutathione lyase family enzyme
MAQFRYIVDDVDEAITFYRDRLGFSLDRQYGPAMAILTKNDLQLWLAGPPASASQPMPDGSKPAPGGWNRIVISVDDISALVETLEKNGVRFKNKIIEGPGGKQVLCQDPSGNVVELFQEV